MCYAHSDRLLPAQNNRADHSAWCTFVRQAYSEVWQAVTQRLLPHFAEAAISAHYNLGINRRAICKLQLDMAFVLLYHSEALVEVDGTRWQTVGYAIT